MKVFQIIGGEVTIINESICYMDTTENFKTDSGLTDLPEMVVYDNKQKCCVVDNLFISTRMPNMMDIFPR